METILGSGVFPYWFFVLHCGCLTSFLELYCLIQSIIDLGRPFVESQLQSLCQNFASIEKHTLWSSDRAFHLRWAFSLPVFHNPGAFFALVFAPIHAKVCLFLNFLSDQPWFQLLFLESLSFFWSLWSLHLVFFCFNTFGKDIFKYFHLLLSLGYFQTDFVWSLSVWKNWCSSHH